MRRILLLAGASVLALSASPVMAQTYGGGGPSYYGTPNYSIPNGDPNYYGRSTDFSHPHRSRSRTVGVGALAAPNYAGAPYFDVPGGNPNYYGTPDYSLPHGSRSVGALAAPNYAGAPYFDVPGGNPNYYGTPDYSRPHGYPRTVGSGIYNVRPLAPNEMLPNGMTPDVTETPAPSDRATVPGNLDAGGDGSESNPNSIQPGASKAGGGGG